MEEFFKFDFEAKEVMLEGVERPTIRSQKKKTQNKNYSGKKKRPTRKNIILADNKKKMLIISPTKHSRVHDKKMSDKNIFAFRLPEIVSLFVDTGFQGIQKQHENTFMPIKKPRGRDLTVDESWWNRAVSSVRVKIEHVICSLKRFNTLSHIFRNKNGLDDKFINICGGIHNLELQLQ